MASNSKTEEHLHDTASLGLTRNDEGEHSIYYEKDTWDERFSLMFETKDFADVNFILKLHGHDPCCLPAHRLILGKRSPVFYQMFYGPECDGNEDIEIHNTEAEDFEFILRYIYGKEIEIRSVSQAQRIRKLADRYKLPLLTDSCNSYIKASLNASNALIVFQESVWNQIPELIIDSLLLIINETANVIKETTLDGVSPNTIKLLLEIHEKHGLNIQSDAKLLEMTLNWGKRYLQLQNTEVEPYNLREVVKPLLPYIRFLSIPSETLRTIAVDILKPEEIDAISKNIDAPNSVPLPSWCNIGIPIGSKFSDSQKVTSVSSVFRIFEAYMFRGQSLLESYSSGYVSVKFRAKNGLFLTKLILSPCWRCKKCFPEETFKLIKGIVLVKIEDEVERSFKINSPNNGFPFNRQTYLNFEPPIYVNAGNSFQFLVELNDGSPLLYSCKTTGFRSSTDVYVVENNPKNGNNEPDVNPSCLFRYIKYVSFKI